jgi:protein involved in polysaccharide export with SLBB domain
VYVDSAGTAANAPGAQSAGENSSARNRSGSLPSDPLTDLQRLARETSGQLLPIFGRDLFHAPPSTFAPVDQIPVLPDYVIGPGDEILVRLWGHTNFNGRLTVDRSGSIYIPEVGDVHVAGERFTDLQAQLQRELRRTYSNFQLSVELGQLRSIRVFVLGEARQPGSYTVSSLATVFNALLASGGPTVQGSLRKIELRRAGQTIATVDLYDFLLRGDKSKDVGLQPGDVVFIPFAGPQAAIGGSVRHPAIYELKQDTSVADLLALAGGLSTTASTANLSIDRITGHSDRMALSIKLDQAGLATLVKDGDVIQADSMLRAFKDSVTIRGNLANAARFSWHSGMKLSDIIPDRESLLTQNYWRERNRLGVPTPLFEPLPQTRGNATQDRQYSQDRQYGQQRGATADDLPRKTDGASDAPLDEALRGAERPADSVESTHAPLAEQQMSASDRLEPANAKIIEVKLPAPEIDWSYAVIERLDPQTLRNTLVPFNLGKLVNDHDQSEDKLLQPGDVVTILSQADVHVSTDEQTKFVRLEGEFGSAGVYSVGPNETLRDVVRRAGGLTNKAYLFGASFTRESARVLQQERLDEYVSQLSAQTERSSAVRAISSLNPVVSSADLTTQQEMLNRLRRIRATGRVVLELKPDSTGIDSVPDIPLENGDAFSVPSRPLMVSMVGAVYGQNVLLYRPDRRVRDYLTLAGRPNRVADQRHEFIIRADGSIFSKDTASGRFWSSGFESTPIYPGDTIVVPEKPIKPSAIRDVVDWSQILSQFAIGAAGLDAVVK